MTRLALLFFFSGFNALVFEVVWTRYFSLVLGSTTSAVAMVTSAFMLGLGLGASASAPLLRRYSPLRVFVGLELCIGLVGALITLALPSLGPWLAQSLPSGPTGDFLRFVTAWLIVAAPCMAMGASLPALVAGLTHKSSAGPTLAILYGLNTLGAALGAYSVDWWLIPNFGVRASGLAAALGDLLVAGLSAAVLANVVRKAEPEAARSRSVWPGGAAFLMALSCGFAGFVAQVAWTRTLVLVNGSDAQAFSLTLGTYLLGLASGSLLLLRWQSTTPERWLGRAFALLSLTLALSCPSIALLAYARGHWAVFQGPAARLLSCACLILPATLVLGALFPLLVARVRRQHSAAGATAGVYLANTVGSVLGALLTGFVLLLWLGIERSLLLASGLVCAVGLLATSNRAGLLASAAVLLGVAWVPGLSLRDVFFREPGREILFYGEDHLGAVAVTRDRLPDQRISHNLVVDGYNMAGDDPGARRYTFLLGFAPLLHHGGENLNALVICLGVGNTARAVTGSSKTAQVDCVELSSTVVRAFPTFPHAPELLDSPKFRLVLNDGRNHLLETDRRYDLITAEPPPPKHAGVVNLYSREYFSLCRARLRPGGVVAQWLPVWEMNQRDVRGVIRAFCDVFPYTYLWEGDRTQLVLTGSLEPPKFSYRALKQLFAADREVLAKGMWQAPELLGASLLMGPEKLRAYTRDSQPLTDNWPFLQYGPEREPPDYANLFPGTPPPWHLENAQEQGELEAGWTAARRLRSYVFATELTALERVILGRRLFETYPEDEYFRCLTLSNEESLTHFRASGNSYQVARILTLRGQFQQALQWLTPGDQALRAVILELAGKREQAVSAYQQALRLSNLTPAERGALQRRLARLTSDGEP